MRRWRGGVCGERMHAAAPLSHHLRCGHQLGVTLSRRGVPSMGTLRRIREKGRTAAIFAPSSCKEERAGGLGGVESYRSALCAQRYGILLESDLYY